MQAALPSLLFRRCHLNCVDSDQFTAESPSELSCIKNCQDKVYQSFELYMGIQYRKAMQAPHNIDKAAYIGMETEHSNDTTGDADMVNQITMNTVGIQQFGRRQQRDHKDLRVEAYKKQ